MFKRLFDPDNALMITMARITDCIFLSLFWLLGSFPVLTAAEIAWLKAAKERGTWLAVALVNDGDAAKFEARREALRALRCVDRVLPVTDWTDLKDAVHNLRIDLIVAKPWQVEQFKNQEELGAEVVIG